MLKTLDFWTGRPGVLRFMGSQRVGHDWVTELNWTEGLKLNIQKSKIMASIPITLWEIDGETMKTVTYFIFLGSKITAVGDCNHEIKRCLLLGRKAVTHLDSILKSRDITLPTKICLIKARFSSSHIWIWELDHKKGWVPLYSWCFQTVVLEKTLENSLDCKEIKPVNPKEHQSWIFIGRTDAEVENPILWPPDVKIPWSWERLKAGGEGDYREWDDWMASCTQ